MRSIIFLTLLGIGFCIAIPTGKIEEKKEVILPIQNVGDVKKEVVNDEVRKEVVDIKRDEKPIDIKKDELKKANEKEIIPEMKDKKEDDKEPKLPEETKVRSELPKPIITVVETVRVETPESKKAAEEARIEEVKKDEKLIIEDVKPVKEKVEPIVGVKITQDEKPIKESIVIVPAMKKDEPFILEKKTDEPRPLQIEEKRDDSPEKKPEETKLDEVKENKKNEDKKTDIPKCDMHKSKDKNNSVESSVEDESDEKDEIVHERQATDRPTRTTRSR